MAQRINSIIHVMLDRKNTNALNQQMKCRAIFFVFSVLLANSCFSQTFLFNYKTDIVWDEAKANYISGVSKINPNHLCISINRTGDYNSEQVVYIFNLANKRLSLKIFNSGYGNRWPVTSQSGNFFLTGQHISSYKHKSLFYRYNNGSQTWTQTFQDDFNDWGRRGYESANLNTSGYWVRAVNSSGKVLLEFYRF